MAADDLVSRLSETLDELERVAREATDGPWAFDGDAVDVVPSSRSGEYIARYVGDVWGDVKAMLPADACHIARWDPQAVLRLVAAHREILRLLETEERVHAEGPSPGSSHWAGGRRSALLNVVHALAKVWGITEEEG